MFSRFFRWIKSVFRSKKPSKTINRPKKPNEMTSKPKEASKKIALWYPNRVRTDIDKLRMRTRGKYKQGFPEGAVVHFTAGRSRDKSKCGRGMEHIERGKREVEGTVLDRAYAYFVIDRDGDIFQNFPLDEWGYHAGKSSYKGIPGTVSNELVGIEIQNAGELKKVRDGIWKAWFTTPGQGDGYFSEEEVRYSSGEANIQRGYYHRYSEKQEEALLNLLSWLHKESRGIFKYDLVVGHDEVSPGRKNDPGASLSMTMPELRTLLKKDFI